MKAKDLKNSILQLAIQGKLVPQDPNDEPASKLLEKIRTAKQKLVKEGKIKKDKQESFIYKGDDNNYYEKIGNDTRNITDEIPFEIPDSWVWTRLKDISIIQEGAGIRSFQYRAEGIQLLTVTNILEGSVDLEKSKKYISNEEYLKKYQHLTLCKGDIVSACSGGSWGKTAIYWKDEKVMLNTSTLRLRFFNDIGNNLYLYLITKSTFFKNQLKHQLSGMQPNFGYAHYSKILIPLPPIQEQQRIVSKIESLEPFIDDYNQAETELSKLNETFPEQIKKSILQYAIQGKLVPQDPSDEPASVLLAKIKAEKQKLINAGKIKKDKVESFIYKRDNRHYEKIGDKEVDITDEIPFKIPDNWVWVRLKNICSYIQRGKSPHYCNNKKIPVISQKCIQWNGFDITRAKFVTEESIKTYSLDRFLQNNDLLWNSTGLGTVGRVAIYLSKLNPYDIAVADSHVTVIRSLNISAQYLYCFLSSPKVQNEIEDICDGSTKQKELALNTIVNYLVPLPPLKEQEKIVQQINNLFRKLPK